MRNTLAWILGLLAAVNGLFMLLAPHSWYLIAPGVRDTGPFNQHFVRDIGCAFLVTGVSLVWFAIDSRARAAALAGAAFMALHALVHAADAIAGRESLAQAARDLPTVYLGAILTLWVAWPTTTLAKGERDVQMADSAATGPVRKGV
jgi:uncharacterized protein YjeT (DUF2065 family)